MNRLFLAFDLSLAVVERLVAVQRELGARLGDASGSVRWVQPENIHVTLKFLGEVDEALLPRIDDVIGALVRPLFPFEVRCCRLGAFESLERPRILWAGLDETGAEVMGLLQQTVERDLGELGFPAETRPFRAHATLARIRANPALDLVAACADLVDLDFGPSYIKDLTLFESIRRHDGVRYVVRRRYPLGEV